MASLSRDYLIKVEKDNRKENRNNRVKNTALRYGTSVDLMALLIGNEHDLDHIPVLYDSEGTA